MNEYKEFLKDYLEGRVSCEEFMDRLKNEKEFDRYILDIWFWRPPYYLIREGLYNTNQIRIPYNSYLEYLDMELNYAFVDCIGMQRPKIKGLTLRARLNTRGYIRDIYKFNFPEETIQLDETESLLTDFLLAYCPESVKSVEVDESGILEKLYENLPQDLPKTKRGKLFKEEVKKLFYIEGNNFPHWIQSSEWPLSKTGKPTKYLRSEKVYKGEGRNYYFQDVDTGEEIKVFQCF